MKVSDFILDTLVAQGVTDVFGITGGMITPLFDAFHGRTDIRYVCTLHEQAAAMAADGYARFRGLGVAIATSGPGATNLITGIGCSYFDSIPTLFITGNVNTAEEKGQWGVRQRGFQETDIVSIVRPITKLARHVSSPDDVAFALESAIWNAKEGRPGPVLLDFPINVLMAEMPETTPHFSAERRRIVDISGKVGEVVDLIAKAKRPVVLYGAGCKNYRDDLLKFVETTGISCLPSWAALDIVPHDHPLYVDTFGVYGSRAGNFTVQNSDLVIAIGTRLDTRMTGADVMTFAPNAVKVVVDLDIHEARKIVPDVTIIADAGDFLREINFQFLSSNGRAFWPGWKFRIAKWKEKYPTTDQNTTTDLQPLNFVRLLSASLPDDAIIVSDAGANLSWVHQAIHIRRAQRIWSAYGYSPMGYALPAAMGASVATGKPVVCLIGDGGFQMNIQELQTLRHYGIPVKVFIMNNDGYGIIQQFQEEVYESRYEGTTPESGVSTPNFLSVVCAYVIPHTAIVNQHQIANVTARAMAYKGPYVVDVEIDPLARIFPKTRFGNPIHDQHPQLDRDELAENMQND